MNIVIIIPTYNEERHIGITIPLVEQVISSIDDHSITILVFDSQSTDKTVSIVRSLQERFNNIILLSEEKKTGLGGAYIKAMRYVLNTMDAEIIFEFDADGSHQPKYIPSMINAIDNGADVAIGSRYIRGGKIDASWSLDRHLISMLGNWVARLFLTFNHHDLTSGFRATKTVFLHKIVLENLLSKNYAYKLHLFWELYRLNAKIIEVPITFIDRQYGYSKFPKNNIIESLKVVISLRIRFLCQWIAAYKAKQ